MSNKITDKLGFGRPMKEAVARFKELTKSEMEAEGKIAPPVADGELELIGFRGAEIRRVCHNDEWWYSITDVIGALVGTDRASKYWTDLKIKLTDEEGFFELSDQIGKLPLPGADGKKRPAEVATPETLFRIIQSISSPKVEPIKRWLAKVGYERIQEWQDPEIAIKRAILTYQIQGRSNDWIETRIRSIVARKELTSEWQQRGVTEGKQYATLTNTISQATFGLPTQRHKMVKGLASAHNLRDHMTNMELILTMLGETSTKEIAQQRDAQGFSANFHAAAAGGNIAGSARKQIERETGRPVVSGQNFLGTGKREADPERLTKK
jgi:DNA-damage-inducible protein D